MLNYLFEMSPVDPTTGLNVTLRLASAHATAAGTMLNNTTWLPAIVSGPTFELTFSKDGIPAPLDASYGQIDFLTKVALGNLDWSRLSFEGASATLWEGEMGEPFANYTQVWSGQMGVFARSSDQVASVALYGSEARLANASLLSATYAGTGGAEGTASLKGASKPYAIGACTNVAPVLVDPVSWIYQVDAYDPCAINAVYENALILGAAASTVTTYAALKALTLKDGEWAAAPAVGMFRLANEPSGKITADIGSAATCGAIVKALLNRAGVADAKIDASVLTATRASCLYVVDQTTVMDSVRKIALEGGRYLIPDATGKFYLGSHESTKAVVHLTSDRSTYPLVASDKIKQTVAAAPVWSVRVGHTRVWSTHSTGEISPAIADLGAESAANKTAAKAAQDAADAAAADADYAVARVMNQASDNILDRTEKLDLVRELEAYTAERAGIIAQGNSFALTTEIATYTTAYANLFNYLNGLSPSINDTTQDTVINANFINYRKAYFTARQGVLDKVPGVTATRAVWATVSGAGKPADYASSGESIILDQDFALSATTGLGTYWVNPTGAVTIDATGGLNGTPALRFAPNGTILDVLPPNWTPCVVGDVFYVQARVYISSLFNGATGTLFSTTCLNKSNVATYPATDIGSIATRDAWVTVNGKVTITGDAVRFKPRLSVRPDGTAGFVLINNVTYQRVQKGATVGAPTGTLIGTMPVEKVVDSVNTDTNLLTRLANAEIQRVNQRAFEFPGPEGQSTYTLVKREEVERVRGQTAFAESISLLGAVAPTGRAFVLNGNSVMVDDGKSSATNLTTINAKFNQNQAAIEDVRQVFVDGDKAIARALTRVDVNGLIVGTALTNDGTTGAYRISVDSFTLEKPSTGEVYFYVDSSGKAKMRNVEVDTIAIGSITGSSMLTGAMGKASLFANDSAVSITGSSWITVAKVKLTSDFGKPLKVLFSSFALCTAGGNNDSTVLFVRVRRNNTVIWGGVNGSKTRVEDEGKVICFSCHDGSMAGEVSEFVVEARTNNSEAVNFTQRQLYAEELSRIMFEEFNVTASDGTGPATGLPGGGGTGGYNPNRISQEEVISE